MSLQTVYLINLAATESEVRDDLTKRFCISCLALYLCACGGGASNSSPPNAGAPPTNPPPSGDEGPFLNPFLADSSWPIFHGNTYSTGSVATIGPGDVSAVESIQGLTDLGDDPFVSPWTVIGEMYSDGSQPVFATPNNGVAKYAIINDRLEAIDFLELDRDTFDFDWALLALAGGDVVVTERKSNRIVIVGDAIDDNAFSNLKVKKRIDVDVNRYGQLLSHHSLAPDGRLIALTQDNKLVAIDLELGDVIAEFSFPDSSGASFQNSFPIDENGRLFVAAQSETVAVDWDGQDFALAWSSRYDMRGPGCEDVPTNRTRREEILAVARGEPCTGTGTTPSLIGTPESGVFVIVDGHSPANNLIAFWRDEPPADWQALPDPNNPGEYLDRRIAGLLPLPFSTPDGDGFTAQNSPAVFENSVVIAQWAGFNPTFDAPRGVQRVDWLADERLLSLAWVNEDIQFNGVPTVACASTGNCQTYGAGRYGQTYDYVSVDFETGAQTGRVVLGFTSDFLDQGNGHAIANDGSIVFAGKERLIRVQ